LIVIITLVLAVGATTAGGSLLNAIVWRRLAVPNPEQVVTPSPFEPGANVDGSVVSNNSIDGADRHA
jgi:hypothetical protein